MSRIRTVCCAATILALTASSGWAQQTYAEGTKQTEVTFSGPVQVPGVTLPAGTYRFRTPQPGDHIVQIFSKDGSQIYATVLTVPNDRAQASDSTVMMFAEQPPDSPAAVKVWFYPGNTTGDEFVYPRTQAVALARANRTTVPSIDDRTAAATDGDPAKNLRGAAVARVDESGRETTSSTSDQRLASTATTARDERPVGTSSQAPARTNAPVTAPRLESSQTVARNVTSADAAAPPDRLPRTASHLGEMAGLSALLLIAGLGLSLVRSRLDR